MLRDAYRRRGAIERMLAYLRAVPVGAASLDWALCHETAAPRAAAAWAALS